MILSPVGFCLCNRGGRADVGNGGRCPPQACLRLRRALRCGRLRSCSSAFRGNSRSCSPLGTVSAILFAIVAARIFWGEQLGAPARAGAADQQPKVNPP
jgi:hypothetical protein